MKKNILSVISFALATTVMMSSCSVDLDMLKVPELIEPVGVEDAYRPCSRHDLGGQMMYIADVLPEDYYHFFKKGVKLDEICVNVGDYVHVGDVLAKADVKEATMQRDLLYTQLNNKTSQYKLDVRKHELTLESLENTKNADEYYKNFHPEYGVDDKVLEADAAAIDMENENKDYLDLTYQYDCRKIREQIQEWEDIIETGTLKAYSEGYVTYVKSLEDTEYAKANEAVAIVSDYNRSYLKLDTEEDAYVSSKYEVKYALVGDKRVPLEDYPFSETEKALMDTAPVRLKAKDSEYKFKVGDRVPVITYRFDKMNVLAVGSDSADYDESGQYVYILKDDGSTEKRYFEMGYSNSFYMEVLSGIEEGENVLYYQSQVVPVSYEEYTVSRGEFNFVQSGSGVSPAEKSARSYFAPDSGSVEEIYVTSQQEVRKGDPLVKIKIDPQKGNLARIQTNIKQENDAYVSDIKTMDERYKKLHDECTNLKEGIKQMRANLDALKAQIAAVSAQGGDTTPLENDKWMLEDSINMSEITVLSQENGIKMIELQKENREMMHNSLISTYNLQYSQSKELNDGTGYRTIYAKEDGIVKTVYAMEGYQINVETGDNAKLLTVVSYFDDIYYLGTSATLREGAVYKLTGTGDSEGFDFEAECVSNEASAMPIAYTYEGKPYLVFTSGQSCKKAYVRIKTEDGSRINSPEYSYEFAAASYENMVLIDGASLFIEVDFKGNTSYYIWKLINGAPVKEYVTVGSDFKIGDGIQPVVLEGLEAGEVIVREIRKNDEDKQGE